MKYSDFKEALLRDTVLDEADISGSNFEFARLNGCDDAVGGMSGVAVKCIDITQNTDCEGIWRIRN